mmetsp:Transcript_15906/g.33270  ORF Transcript_15906/g.33270 Transcript_15906/m.33270 type:complete len:316 (-) Transcript_15906:304-1251(-)
MPIIRRHRSSIQPIMTNGPEPQSSSTKSPIKSCMKVATLHESLKSCETSKRSSIFGSAFHSPFLSSSTTSSHQRRRLSIFATRKDSADGAAADSHHREADHKIHHVNGEQASSSPGHLRQTLFKVLSIARLERPDGAGHRRVSTVSSSIGRSKKGEGTERPFKGLVKFSDVTIREFDLTASDNPAVRGGAAIELGWKYNILNPTTLEEFESIRSTQRSPDFAKDKRLTRHERQRILREFGFTNKDIQEAAKRATIIRNKRKRSIALMSHDHLYEALEEVKIFLCGGCRNCDGSNSAVLEDYGSKVHPSLVADQDC